MSTDEVDFDIDVSRDQQVWPAFHGGWAVRRAGTKKYFRVYRTKAEALRHATEIARRKGVRLFVHYQHGAVQRWRDFAEGPRARWHQAYKY